MIIKSIHDLFFKVRIKSKSEHEEVIEHLKSLCIFYADDEPYNQYNDIGLTVGRGYAGQIFSEAGWMHCQSDDLEMTVKEVLNIKLGEEMKEPGEKVVLDENTPVSMLEYNAAVSSLSETIEDLRKHIAMLQKENTRLVQIRR